MAHFINPFTDVGFKKIFGQEMTKDLLIDFLNDLLVDEKKKQVEVARNFKQMGLSIEVITRGTGFTAEEVESL